MNNILFKFFFSWSSFPAIAWSSLFVSNFLIYLFIIIALAFPLIKHRDFFYSILVGGTGFMAFIVSYIIKNIFMVPRPFITDHIIPLVVESGYSFPSSHVTVISALSVVIWKINHKLGYLFFVFTIFVAFSRMIIGVHYPIDVIAGMFFGIIIGLLALWFYKITKQFAFLKKKL